MTTTQPSGAPLPLPMRVSAGFLVTDLSGKTRMKTLPPRRTKRVITRRAASIWRFVIQAASEACRPNSPKARSAPWVATPVRRPRWSLRYLTRAGSNMTYSFFFVARGARGAFGVAVVSVVAALARVARLGFSVPSPSAVAAFVVRVARYDLADGATAVATGADTGADSTAAGGGAGAHRLGQGLLDGTAEGDTLLELGGDVLRYQLSAEFGLLDLLDRHPDPLAGDLLQIVTQLVDAGPTLADDDAGLGGVQRDGERRRRALGLDAGDTRLLEAGPQQAAEADVPEHERPVLLSG